MNILLVYYFWKRLSKNRFSPSRYRPFSMLYITVFCLHFRLKASGHKILLVWPRPMCNADVSL